MKNSIELKANKLVVYDSLNSSKAIPEPTMSLLWITNEDPKKIKNPLGLKINIGFDGNVNNSEEDELFSEPSLIWTKLEVTPNNNLENKPMYWPVYARFTPEIRFQYLNWLTDITKPTNLSFVFLYFYGLERHLLVGDYDMAVEEILRLLKYHTQGSFKYYATRSLIVASIIRKRPDIIARAPFIMQEEIDEALALRIISGTPITAEDIISISTKVGFKNKRYIKLYPEIFNSKLTSLIDSFEKENGRLLSLFKIEDFKVAPSNAFANMSIMLKIRGVPIPMILENKKFKTTMFKLLQMAHEQTGEEVKAKRSKSESTATPKTILNQILGVCPNCNSNLYIKIKRKTECPNCHKYIFVYKGELVTFDKKIIEETKKGIEYTNITIPESIRSIDSLVNHLNQIAEKCISQKDYDNAGTMFLNLGIISFENHNYKDCIKYYLLCSHYDKSNLMDANPVKDSLSLLELKDLTPKDLEELALDSKLNIEEKIKILAEKLENHKEIHEEIHEESHKAEHIKAANPKNKSKIIKIILITLLVLTASCCACFGGIVVVGNLLP